MSVVYFRNMNEQYGRSMVGIEADDNSGSQIPEKTYAPDVACFPENKLWIPEYGNVLICFVRHGMTTEYHSSEALLDEEVGIPQVEAARDIIRGEIAGMPTPIDIYGHYSNRKRTEQTHTILLAPFIVDESESRAVKEMGTDQRISTADDINRVVELTEGQPHKVIPTWRAMDRNTADGIGARFIGETFKNLLNYIQEKNLHALEEDPTKMHVYIASTHESTHAAITNFVFPNIKPEDHQARHGEILSVTTGNPEGDAVFVWRKGYAEPEDTEETSIDSIYPPHVINLPEYISNMANIDRNAN